MGLVQQFKDTSVHPGIGFTRNTLLNENACLVCCFLRSCDIYWLNISFYKICLLGCPSGGWSPLEKIGGPDGKDHWALSVLTEVCNARWGVLITHAAMTVLWYPWVGLTKELVEVSEISSNCLLKDHCLSLLALFLSVKLMGVQYSALALSCCKENIFGEGYLYPEGTVSTFGKDQPVDGMWTGPSGYGTLWLVTKYIIIL